MARRELSRDELFALVWEKPTQEIAKELGVSDVAIAKLCARLQVPKPPRGYWARVRSGQTPRRPPLAAFREEIERSRKEAARARAAGSLSSLQQQFYQAALSELKGRDVDVSGAQIRGGRLPDLSPDLAAQILLLIQSRANQWVEDGKVNTRWSHPVERSAAGLVEKLLPVARPQLLVFESERKRSWYGANGPAVLVRLTPHLQERIASLVRIVRDQKLQHVVMPLMASDHAWSAKHLFAPASHVFLDSTLCVSATEIWVECSRRAWREEDPPERVVTNRMKLQAIMPIDHMPVRDVPLTPVVTRAAVEPYDDRLRALREAERIYDLLSEAVYAMEREVPDERLAIVDRIWFGKRRPFWSAREAWRDIQDQLEGWGRELDAERSALARSILKIDVGDIVTTESRGRVLRISVTDLTVYATEEHVTFIVNGTRFRKDGTLGKLQETVTLHFKNES